jgi:hypothetical protein
MSFGFCNKSKGGHVILMVKQDMNFNPTLCSSKLCPREKIEAERYGGRIKAQEFVVIDPVIK